MEESKLFDFINGDSVYECYGATRTRANGISLLLKSTTGNWIVANGVNVETGDTTLALFGFMEGDWNYGHYFLDDKIKAVSYFNVIKEG